MLDIQQVLKQDRLVRALTGLNRKAFDQLLVAFSPVYEQSRQTQPRTQSSVIGHPREAVLHAFLLQVLPHL